MSLKGESKVPTAKKDVVLTPETYLEWKVADVLTTGIPYVEPRPTAATYLPAVAAGDSPLTDAMKGKLKERAFDRYQTRLDKGVDDKVLMYFILVATISTVSLILIKQHANYLVGCEQQRNGEILAAIIASTHHNEIGGNNVLRTHFMREKKEIEFGLFKMTSDMDLGSFYKQFVEFRATLTKQGHPVPEDKREAQKFLQRLDDRYSDMMASMANGTLVGVKYPKNLAKAYETAAQYVVPPEKMKKPAGTSTSTYLTSEEIKRSGQDKWGSRRQRRTGWRPRRRRLRSTRCDREEREPSAEEVYEEDSEI